MTWEWCIVTGGETLDRTTAAAVGSVALAIIAGVVGSYQVAVWLLAVGAMGVVVLLARGSGPRAAWLAFGICYVGLACLAFQWLRVRSLDLVILLLVVVWATDIAAYFVGRTARAAPSWRPPSAPRRPGRACVAVPAPQHWPPG